MMDIYFTKPGGFLKEYIDRYWICESPDGSLPKILPGTGLELIFHYGTSVNCDNHEQEHTRLPSSHIICLRGTAFNVKGDGRVRFLAVRFKAGAFRHFCPVPMSELVDSFMDIGDIWGHPGEELRDRVLDRDCPDECLSLIEAYLTRVFNANNKPDQIVDYAVKSIYYNFRTVDFEGMARFFNISRRHFQRVFKKAIGVGPKSFQRSSRFQSTIRELLLSKQKQYLDTAIANGYYDQPHFLKEFTGLVNETPSSFLNEKNFMSHFYNPKSYK